MNSVTLGDQSDILVVKDGQSAEFFDGEITTRNIARGISSPRAICRIIAEMRTIAWKYDVLTRLRLCSRANAREANENSNDAVHRPNEN